MLGKSATKTHQCNPCSTQLYIRTGFIEEGGLKLLAQYLSPIYDHNNEPQEPSIASKLRVVKMLVEFRMDSTQVKSSPRLIQTVKRNKGSRVMELSSLCKELIDRWDDSAFNAPEPKKKKTQK